MNITNKIFKKDNGLLIDYYKKSNRYIGNCIRNEIPCTIDMTIYNICDKIPKSIKNTIKKILEKEFSYIKRIYNIENNIPINKICLYKVATLKRIQRNYVKI